MWEPPDPITSASGPVLAFLLLLLLGCGTAVSPGPFLGLAEEPPPEGARLRAVTDLVVEPDAAAGAVVLRFTAPGEPGEARPSGYRVRVSRRHITDATLADSTILPTPTHEPGAVGTPEAVRLAGLEPGRTLQFTVEALHGDEVGPRSEGAACRVPGRDVPAPPADAIRLDRPGVIDGDGTYLLTQDVVAPGTAFRITASKVVFDLGGHTITYGTTTSEVCYGVHAEWLAADSNVIVRNGRVVQGAAGASSSHGLFLRGLKNLRLSYLDVDVNGSDAIGVVVATVDGSVRVDHCTVASRTHVVTNRHYPGVSGIHIEDITASAEIDQNRVTASPQWGIRMQGRTSSGPVLVHHNEVLGTKARVANGYMLGVYKPDADVYENRLVGESRGIHIDGVDGSGQDAWIHDNHVQVQDQPNEEYPGRTWAHGIKIEEAPGCRVVRNHVSGLADDQHGDIYAIDIQMGPARGIQVVGNRVYARSVSSVLQGRAVEWTLGSETTANDIVVAGNVFSASDVLIHRDWVAGHGGLFTNNWWLREPTDGAPRVPTFERFDNSDAIPSDGHALRDPITDEDVLRVTQWANPAAYESSRLWTVRICVKRDGAPRAGAQVRVTDRQGAAVWTQITDASGCASGPVPAAVVRTGPVVDDRNGHTLRVTPPGGAEFTWPLDVRGRAAVAVDLTAGTATPDTTPPEAPMSLTGHALSASRILLRWEAAEDDSAVVGYLVRLDGVPVGVTDGTSLIVAGLKADTAYLPSVRALDAAGLTGSALTGAPVRTRAEDRGP